MSRSYEAASVSEMSQEGLTNPSVAFRDASQTLPSNVSFTPDLVIDGGDVVADVKYSLLGSDWSRSHLYQIIAFAKAFGASKGIVLGFTESGATPSTVDVEGIEVSAIGWKANSELGPGQTRDSFLSKLVGRLELELHRTPLA